MTPINYTEKGAGLWAELGRMGLHLVEIGGVMQTASDPAAVQAAIDGYTLDQAKAARSIESQRIARELRDRVVAGVSPGEMAAWSVKRAEAQAYAQTQDPAVAPLLSAEATARGVTLQHVIARVASNAASYAAMEAAIAGADGRHRDAIAALTSFDGVAGYDLTVGWPEV